MPLQPWPALPSDVIRHVRGIFRSANKLVAGVLLNQPNERETTLDSVLTDAVIPNSAPTKLVSGAIVELEVHNIGGLRRYSKYETADLAVIVRVYDRSNLHVQKLGLLQSKRLYPENNIVKDEDPVGFLYGLNAILQGDAKRPFQTKSTEFRFNELCVYGALSAGTEQVETIDDFNEKFESSIYYLLYNPPSLPVTVYSPRTHRIKTDKFDEGCRVVPTSVIHQTVGALQKGASPTLKAIKDAANTMNWTLEYWAADLLLKCKAGRQFDANDPVVAQLVDRRSGPMASIITISISLPPE